MEKCPTSSYCLFQNKFYKQSSVLLWHHHSRADICMESFEQYPPNHQGTRPRFGSDMSLMYLLFSHMVKKLFRLSLIIGILHNGIFYFLPIYSSLVWIFNAVVIQTICDIFTWCFGVPQLSHYLWMIGFAPHLTHHFQTIQHGSSLSQISYYSRLLFKSITAARLQYNYMLPTFSFIRNYVKYSVIFQLKYKSYSVEAFFSIYNQNLCTISIQGSFIYYTVFPFM